MCADQRNEIADAFFSPHRRARSPAATDLILRIQSEFAAREVAQDGRQRRRRSTDERRHDQMVEAVLCDALHRHLTVPNGAVAISLGRERRSRYAPPPYAPMKSLLSGLGSEGLALLTIQWGQRHPTGGLRTTAAPSSHLLAMANGLTLADFGCRPGSEPIVLRQVKRNVARKEGADVPDWFDVWTQTGAEIDQLVEYDDSPLGDELRADIDLVNHALDVADITLDESAMATPQGPVPIDPGDRSLRRVFNNGYGDFRHGGRLTGGFWMSMPKVMRRAIRIRGEPVIELDYRAMMPRLLYAHVGQPYPVSLDPYSIPGIHDTYRAGVKSYLLSLLFGPTALARWPQGCKSKFAKGINREWVLQRLRDHHPAIASSFGTIIGFELLRRESDILVRVLLSCIARDIVVLPIHDAVLCPASKADECPSSGALRQFEVFVTGGSGSVSVSG